MEDFATWGLKWQWKTKGVFKWNLVKEGKGGKIRKRACTQKEYGDGGLRWLKIMKNTLKSFQLLWSLGLFDYYQG